MSSSLCSLVLMRSSKYDANGILSKEWAELSQDMLDSSKREETRDKGEKESANVKYLTVRDSWGKGSSGNAKESFMHL